MKKKRKETFFVVVFWRMWVLWRCFAVVVFCLFLFLLFGIVVFFSFFFFYSVNLKSLCILQLQINWLS
jgi:hypothetical protein